MEVLRSFHGMRYGRYPLGTLYLFPTTNVVSDFSSSRFDPLIANNPETIGQYVQSTDRIGLKKICGGYLYLRGARLSQKVQGTDKQGAQLTSIPVDRDVFDEVDLMDKEAITKALGRMGHSKVKEEVYLSNPTIPNYGIDKLYTESDQNVWDIKCDSCNTYTCLEMEFPKCIKIRKDGTGVRVCKKCGKEIFRRKGLWVPQYPGREMEGYWWSQLNSAYVDPGTILKAFNDPPDGEIKDVYRLMLGIAYISIEDQLTESAVLACCGVEKMPNSFVGPCAMGIDVGKTLYVVIGYKINPKQYVTIKTTRVDNWNAIHDLARRYNVRSCVIDIGPDIFKPREFQQAEPYEIFLCRYSETLSTGTKWDLKTGVVTVNRTEVCDQTHWLVMTPGMLTIPRLSDEIKQYTKEMCALAKVPEKDDFTGAIIERYKNIAPDHYRHATNYFYLAAQRIGFVSTQYTGSAKQTQADMSYSSLG